MNIVGLLPVRNGEDDLPAWLAGAPAWCDVVVALDDGSTDGTRALLEASPLVVDVLSNDVRPTSAGWDDGANRNRLLAAAGAHKPAWIVQVDADERIAPDDASVLRAFLASDALPGVAYGLQHVRMWGDDHHDGGRSWVYRVFAWEPGQQVADQHLHGAPVPMSIPRSAWLRTTIRLQHFGGASDARIAARRRKYAEADPGAAFPTSYGGLDTAPAIALDWEPRPPGLPVLCPPLTEQPGPATAGRGPVIACLLPVRNGAADLPGWLESVGRFADAVIALDDGSTDDTRAQLDASPLVKVVLSRPKRPDYKDWDDAGNRAALLDAAAVLEPQWIVWLDADERISADDAAALRDFVETAAEPDRAYGLRVHRMVDDLAHWDRNDLVAYRLFAWHPGQRLPPGRLHAVPVPTSISASQFVPTTLRIQHLAGLDAARRHARFAKYREADPDHEYQADYGELLTTAPPRPWTPRPAGLAVVDGPTQDPLPTTLMPDAFPEPDLDLDAPVLSAIVIAHDDAHRIAATVRSVVDQEVDEPFEVIVVVSGTDATAAVVRTEFPSVTVVDLGPRATPGAARNAGLAVARGDYVSFPGSHVVLPPGSLAARLRAHQAGWPMVTGTTMNLTDTRAGWASYFLDHSGVLPGRPSERLSAPPAHCSYDRELLVRAGGFPEDRRTGEDTVVNTELFRRGHHAWRAADVVLGHESPCRDLPTLVRHHFQRGRGLGRIIIESLPAGGRLWDDPRARPTFLAYLPRRLGAIRANVARWGDDRDRVELRRARPWVVAGVASAWAGTLTEVLRPRPGWWGRTVGTPALNLVVAGLDTRPGFPVGRTDALLAVRVEPVRALVRVLSVPRDLLVSSGAGVERLNEAWFRGASAAGPRAGLVAVEAAVSAATRLPVHGAVVVDFRGFVDLVDIIGGVDVDVPHAIDDESDEIGPDGERFAAHFAAGPQHLDGEDALRYARTRMADGDRWRRQRHADLVGALVRSAASTATDPRRLRELAAAARRSIHAHVGRGRAVLAGQALWRARRRPVVVTHLGPPEVRSERLDGQWVHRGDPDAIAAFVRQEFLGGPPT